MNTSLCILIFALCFSVARGCFKSEENAFKNVINTLAYVKIEDGINGWVQMRDEGEENTIRVKGRFRGLKPKEKYSLRIHSWGDISRGCKGVGIPFPPKKSEKELIDSTADLVLLKANTDGNALINFKRKGYSASTIIGRSLSISEVLDPENSDNLYADLNIDGGKLNTTACSVIGIVDEDIQITLPSL